MISFIVIGQNEGWKLDKCLSSIHSCINANEISDAEIIYVDSNSTDDSVEIARANNVHKIFSVTGECNAAIGRNVGGDEASGDVLFFIDGDMEINSNVLSLLYDESVGLKYDYCSGNYYDYFYDNAGNVILKTLYNNDSTDKVEYLAGGIFLIKRDVWQKIKGMKNKLRKSQDWDLSFRLAKNGVFLLRIKEVLAIHHTQSYRSSDRLFKSLIHGDKHYRIVILRDNIINKYQWRHFIRINYTFIIFNIILVYAFSSGNLLSMLVYPAILVLRVILRKPESINVLIIDILSLLIYEVSIWGSFLFFWPKEHSLAYKQIQ